LKRISNVIVLALAFISSSSISPSFAAEPAFRAKSIGGPNSAVFFVEERTTETRSLSTSSRMNFFERPWIQNDPIPNIGDCRSTKDPDCDFSKMETGIASSVLGVCDSTITINCIEGISFGSSRESLVPAKFTRYLASRSIPEDLDLNFYGGKTASIWSAENAPNPSGANSYLVAPVVDFYIKYKESPKFRATGFSVDITPFSTKFQNGLRPEEWKTQEQIVRENLGTTTPLRYLPKTQDGWDKSGDCFASQIDQCLVQYDFPSPLVIQMKIRLSKELGGWFKGRMTDPVINVENYDDKNNVITVTAKPIEVAQVAYAVDQDKLSDSERSMIRRYAWGGTAEARRLVGPAATGEGDRVFDYMNEARDLFKDRARGTTTFWNFGTVNAGSGSPCLADTSKVLGIVTTNAMGYQGTAPTFEQSTLAYRVVGPHFMPDGVTEVRGTYDLVMKSEVARCLYNFSNAPISATISITSGNGEAAVATTTISEENGWLKLGAYNFTFSSPTLKVKLTQKPVVVPQIEAPKTENIQIEKTTEASQAAEPKVTVVKKKQITCVKGKITKKISGVNPKCPTGFKKK